MFLWWILHFPIFRAGHFAWWSWRFEVEKSPIRQQSQPLDQWTKFIVQWETPTWGQATGSFQHGGEKGTTWKTNQQRWSRWLYDFSCFLRSFIFRRSRDLWLHHPKTNLKWETTILFQNFLRIAIIHRRYLLNVINL